MQVHELGFSDLGCPKAYVFRGSKELSKEEVLDQLGLPSGPGGGFQRGAMGLQAAGAGPGNNNNKLFFFLNQRCFSRAFDFDHALFLCRNVALFCGHSAKLIVLLS